MRFITVDLGETAESIAFFERHPEFLEALPRLLQLSNKVFGRDYHPNDRLRDIAFSLGETCRMDFTEILFLAVHGWGIGAMKLLRGMYERAVTLAYMIKHPEKAERFFRYAAIQEYKVMRAALEVVDEKTFNEAMTGNTTVAQITALREQYEKEFQTPVCKKCYEKGSCVHTTTAFSWDKNGVLAQAQAVGEPYAGLYFSCYAIPNMHTHVSLTSAMLEHDKKPEEERRAQRRREGDFALLSAHAVLLLVIRSQNILFELALDEEIDARQQQWQTMWIPTR